MLIRTTKDGESIRPTVTEQRRWKQVIRDMQLLRKFETAIQPDAVFVLDSLERVVAYFENRNQPTADGDDSP